MRFNTERSVRSIFSEEDKDYLISRLQQEIDKIKAEIKGYGVTIVDAIEIGSCRVVYNEDK